MTGPAGGDIPVNTFPGIRTDAAGGVIFGSSAPGAPAGQQNIWNLPKGLPAKLWYDTGHTTTQEHPDTSTLAGIEQASKGQLGKVTSSHQNLVTPAAIMRQIVAMSVNPDWRPYLALQQALGVRLTGKWDPATDAAIKQEMVQYAQIVSPEGAGAAISFKDWLMQGAERAQQLGLGAQKAPTPTLMDPAQIRMAAQNAAQAALGTGLSSDQLDQFVKQFQAEQISNAATGGGDLYSTSTKLPGEAMAFAQSSNPGAFKGNQRQTFEDTLVNMFAPSQSQRPNMTPVPSVNPVTPSPGGASVRG